MKSPTTTEAIEAYLLLAVAMACLCWFSYRSTIIRIARQHPIAVQAASPPAPATAAASPLPGQ